MKTIQRLLALTLAAMGGAVMAMLNKRWLGFATICFFMVIANHILDLDLEETKKRGNKK